MCRADFCFPESPRPLPQFCNEPQSFNPSGDGTKLCACILTFPYKAFWLKARSSGEADLR